MMPKSPSFIRTCDYMTTHSYHYKYSFKLILSPLSYAHRHSHHHLEQSYTYSIPFCKKSKDSLPLLS